MPAAVKLNASLKPLFALPLSKTHNGRCCCSIVSLCFFFSSVDVCTAIIGGVGSTLVAAGLWRLCAFLVVRQPRRIFPSFFFSTSAAAFLSLLSQSERTHASSPDAGVYERRHQKEGSERLFGGSRFTEMWSCVDAWAKRQRWKHRSVSGPHMVLMWGRESMTHFVRLRERSHCWRSGFTTCTDFLKWNLDTEKLETLSKSDKPSVSELDSVFLLFFFVKMS